ncbi:MAG: glycoside hydrolase family 18 [Prevotellaceae bacterium]|nr:glycoside hydrolase family 18 [Prevotellaceae bacterium]
MKKIAILLTLLLAGMMAACSEWTVPEALPIERPSIEAENPALYQQYLENLRNYKKSYHPLLIGWFDNSDKSFSGRASHLKALPDKVDIVALMYGDNLADVEREEMAAIRNDKGTKTVYTIDYEAFLLDINTRNEEIDALNEAGAIAAAEAGEDYTPIPLLVPDEELPGFMDNQLALLDKYGYDGFGFHYVGKSSAVMTPAQKAELQATQDILLTKLGAVMQRYPEKLFLFEGRPDRLLNKELLADFDYIVFRTQTATNTLALTETVKISLVTDVPANNIIVCASPYSTDTQDTKTGRMTDETGATLPAITAMAWWVTVSDSFTKAGLGVYRINDDYFNPETDYKLTREAIEIMNPSSKN